MNEQPDNESEITVPAEKMHPYLIPVIAIIACFIGFAGLTIAYNTWTITNSEHKWCQVIDLLSTAHAPKPAPGNPSRIYESLLSRDFLLLKGRLGC